ncbi:GGDEF domain-containing protein [Acetobacteraceae bacterium H6797]|nr:GGDEF domain-containing protein [Acetobacteraceae bacterium H6797]
MSTVSTLSWQAGLLSLELCAYLGLLLLLFRMREFLGIGTFLCALGSLHFLETWLAATVFVSLPYGLALSPGSVVLFTGKLMMILMVYIVQDAGSARQAVYGLFAGNILMFALAFIIRWHWLAEFGPAPAFEMLDQMGWLMLWGTTLLFIDCILAILLYEKISRSFTMSLALRLWVTAAIVLSFDQLAFFSALRLTIGLPWSAALAGWLGKLAVAALCAAILSFYLRRCEPAATLVKRSSRQLGDIFDVLTYRQRYEQLAAASDRDALTGVLHRGQFDLLGRQGMEDASHGKPLSLVLLDIDHFKSINDRFGHPAGDAVLRQVAEALAGVLGGPRQVIRYGGEEFAAFLPGLEHERALAVAAKLRAAVSSLPLDGLPPEAAALRVTVSIGVATSPADGQTLGHLLDMADARLYAAKNAGRDKVVGERGFIAQASA